MTENLDNGAPEPAEGLSPLDLGAVCLAVYGVWTVVVGLVPITMMLANAPSQDVFRWSPLYLHIGLSLVVGGLLFFGARRIAGLVLPDQPRVSLPDARTVMIVGISLVGLWACVSYAYELIRLVLPLDAQNLAEEVAIRHTVSNAVMVGAGLLLFARARALMGLWARWNLLR